MNAAPPLTCIWEPADQSGRADKILAAKLGVSRTRLQNWLARGLITAGGRPLAPGVSPKPGDLIIAHPPPPAPDRVQPEHIPLDILHEDQDIIAINKPPGLVVHPGAGHPTGTLVAALLHHCGPSLSGVGDVQRPGIVHRLDRDTSGVLIAAKNDAAHHALAAQFKSRTLHKTYLAFVHGCPAPPRGTWDGPIRRHPVQRQRMTVAPGGRPARTDYRVRQTWPGITLLELDLLTGRTHQIRVHAAHAGHPILGDELYGRRRSSTPQVPRQLLHAWKLEFHHPRTGKRLYLEAPIPQDFHHLLQTIG